MNKTTESLSMTLTPEVMDRFNQIWNSRDWSKPKVLEALLDCYEKHTAIPEDATPLSVSMYCDSTYGYKIIPQTIDFLGKVLYEPNWTRSTLDFIRCEKLHEEIYKEPFVFDSGVFSLRHKLNLYHNYEEKTYLVQECIQLDRIFNYQHFGREEHLPTSSQILDLKRCQFVNNFDDIVKHFGKYSSIQELDSIRHMIPNSIGTNYHLMDKLF